MKPIMNRLAVVALISALPISWAAAKGDYPTQPIRLLVGYAPGGSVDIVAREYAQHLSKLVGQSVVVENRGGASGTIAGQTVARAKPDGHTLFFTASPTVTVTPAIQETPFDPIADFQPISSVVTYTNVLLVNANSPYSTMQDLVEDAKANPGQLTYGSSGVGASNHLTGELLQDNAEVELTHIPYKGNAPAQADLIADRITMLFDLNTTAKAQVDGGKVKALAVTSGTRNPMFKDVPTMVEAGYPDYVFDGWLGLLAPSDVSEDVVKTLSEATNKIVNDKDFRARMEDSGYTLIESSPEQLPARIAEEGEQFRDLAERANLRQE